MSSVTHLEPPTDAPVSFGRSADGMNVALVGEAAFAMAPARDGRHILVTAWNIRRPMEGWTRNDFYGHCGDLADEAAFRSRVIENAEHQREKRALGRREIALRAHTPWGQSQRSTIYAEGVICHTTAGHGGFHLSAERNRKVNPALRVRGGFYEEDEAWSIVAITFPHLFTAFERRCAEKTFADAWPDAWEVIFGKLLLPGESRTKDRRAFEIQHAGDWVVTSAISSSHETGFVECVATVGGKRGEGVAERRFLVPAGEYEIGRFGFVIDPDRHPIYHGRSDFVGWRAGKAA